MMGKVTNVRGTMNTLGRKESVIFSVSEAKDSYVRHTAAILKRDTGKVFRVNYIQNVGTRVTRIA